MEYQQVAAAGFSCGTQYGARVFLCGGAVVLERCPGGAGGFVFGTLLGPETTGPWRFLVVFPCGGMVRGSGVGLVFLVSWLHRSHGLAPLRGGSVWGVWYGVVV